MSLFISLLALFGLIWTVSGLPAPNFVTCDCVSVNRPQDGQLFTRDVIMGLSVQRSPEPPLVDSAAFASTESTWATVMISNEYSPGILAYTDNGALRLKDGEVNDCEGADGILYGIAPDSIVEWRPDTENSKLWVFQSLGIPSSDSTPVLIQTLEAANLMVDETPIDDDDDDEKEPEPVTMEEDEFKDQLFIAAVVITTLFYANFLWVTIDPLSLASKH